MPKIVTSPVSKFPGTVTLLEPHNIVATLEFEKALRKYVEQIEAKAYRSEAQYHMIPGIIACVQEWNLDGFPASVTLESFPTSPRNAASDVINWLFNEIHAIYQGDTEDAKNA
jgi:hypothetical protein